MNGKRKHDTQESFVGCIHLAKKNNFKSERKGNTGLFTYSTLNREL